MIEEIEIKTKSGTLSASIFGATNPNDTVLIIASATGVKQEFYKKFAQFIAINGITVITFDYYGIGRSLKKPIKELKNNAADWGRNDLESVLKYTLKNFSASKKVLLGHSIGGQLIGLSETSTTMDKIVLVAAQSGFWKFWKGRGKAKMWFNWYVLFPVLINIFGYLPSKRISGMEDLPKNVANQWRNWGKNSNYLLSDINISESFFDKIHSEITAFSIDDDKFAPKKAVDWMTAQYSKAKKKSIHLAPKDYDTGKIGHFGVFKDKFQKTIWEEFLNEIK